MVPLLRAVAVWAAALATILVTHPTASASFTPSTLTRGFDALMHRNQHSVALQVEFQQRAVADASTWQAAQDAEAARQAEVARINAEAAAFQTPPNIQQIIVDAFSPQGPAAVTWALRVAYCESRYHPNSVNSDSGASGLFQFLPSTWAFTPYASQSPFDPVANAHAAAWLYQRDGPSQWQCQ